MPSFRDAQQRAASVQGMLQQNKMGKMELDEAMAAKKEQQALQALYMETQGDMDKLLELAPMRGVRPQSVSKLKEARLKEQEDIRKQKVEERAERKAKIDGFGSVAGSILSLPPEQRGQAVVRALPALVQEGTITPQQAQEYGQLGQAPPEVVEQQLKMALTMAAGALKTYDRIEAEEKAGWDAQAKREELTVGQKEFADFYAAYRESEGKPKNAKVEMEARTAYRQSLQAPRQPVPGTDIPLPADVEAQRQRMHPPTDTTRGSFIPLTDEQGRVIAAWNPKMKQVVEVPPELAGARKSGLSDTALARRAMLSNMSEDIGMVDQLSKKFRATWKIGTVTGRMQSWGRAIIGGDEDAIRMERSLNNLSDMLLRARSGAQINEQEYIRLVRLIPQVSDSEDVFFTKMKDFSSDIKRLLEKGTVGGAALAGAQPGKGKVLVEGKDF